MKKVRTQSNSIVNAGVRLGGLRLKNFKLFKDAQCGFEPFTVFVGMNGAGKSTISRALSLLPWAHLWGLRSAIRRHGGARTLFRQDAESLSCEVFFDFLAQDRSTKVGQHYHNIELTRANTADGYEVRNESLIGTRNSGAIEYHGKSVRQKIRTPTEVIHAHSIAGRARRDGRLRKVASQSVPLWELASFFSSFELRIQPLFRALFESGESPIRFDPTSTRVFRTDGKDVGWLENESTALWNWLSRLCRDKELNSDRRNWFESLRRFMPWIQEISAEVDVTGATRLLLRECGKNFHPLQISDGTLMLMGHLGVLESQPSILIVDEPELHLHPDAIVELIRIYRERLHDAKSGLNQVILLTQSPLVVKCTHPHELRTINRCGTESTISGVSEEPSEFARQLAQAGMSLDEAWLANFFGGNPVINDAQGVKNAKRIASHRRISYS